MAKTVAIQAETAFGQTVALLSGRLVALDLGPEVGQRRTVARREVGGRQTERDYGKTVRSMRSVSITDDLASDLGSAKGNGHIFTATRGGKLARSNFRRIWLAACAEAGVKGVRVHDLRHTHASWLVNNCADLIAVRDRLGHSDLKTTSRYLVLEHQHQRVTPVTLLPTP